MSASSSSKAATLKRPAAPPIAPPPTKAATMKEPAKRRISGLFPSGLATAKDWLEKVRQPHDQIKFRAKSGLSPKAAVDSSMVPYPGIPPPIAQVLKSHDLLRLWSARWEKDRVKAFDMRPEKDAIVIAGRPVRTLVVSHHKAGPLEWDTYFNMLYAPLRPLILFGASAQSSEAPTMNAKFSVIQWWKVIVYL